MVNGGVSDSRTLDSGLGESSYDRNATDGKAIPRIKIKKYFDSVFIRGMALPSVVTISALRGEVIVGRIANPVFSERISTALCK